MSKKRSAQPRQAAARIAASAEAARPARGGSYIRNRKSGELERVESTAQRQPFESAKTATPEPPRAGEQTTSEPAGSGEQQNSEPAGSGQQEG